jgi:hypothetical protein
MTHPFNALVAGPSQSGKTWWIMKLLSTPGSIRPKPQRILYCYAEWQPAYRNLSLSGNVEFVKGLPTDILSKLDGTTPTLVILDDLMIESSSNKEITSLFVRGTHHKNASVILVCQNLFEKGLRTISLNSHFIVLFFSPRDQQQIASLARQLYPKNKSQFLVEAYNDATSVSGHSYLFLDLKQTTNKDLRVKTNVFSENNFPPIVYTP